MKNRLEVRRGEKQSPHAKLSHSKYTGIKLSIPTRLTIFNNITLVGADQ